MSVMRTVKQGEYLSSIALDEGFLDWHTIYNDPNNADLWKKRDSPDILLPGDQVFIPDKQDKQESCSTEQRHEFELYQPRTWLNIILKDAEGNAIANEAYTLTIAGQMRSDTTDGTGLVHQEIPIGVTRGHLTLDNLGVSCELRIGHLDPIHDQGDPVISGIQARLNNSGFPCGAVDGIWGPKTQAALMRFQASILARTNPDGQPDGETVNALKEQHGC
jgi:hypothetical protein